MNLASVHSKTEIEGFTRKNPLIHLYEIGDLDDFFWPKTIWYALMDFQEIKQLALIYTGSSLPVLLAHSEEPQSQMDDLLRQLLPFLPARFYTHMSERSAAVVAEKYVVKPHGAHIKMGLKDFSKLKTNNASGAVRLTESDVEELKVLYSASYPGNWFDPRMLQTGFYFGLRETEKLVSVAGVHVVSQQYRVAALGNVTTHPNFRGKGFATAACAKLCQELRSSGVEQIGLNVKADNSAAIASYKKLGFEKVGTYGEFMCEMKMGSKG